MNRTIASWQMAGFIFTAVLGTLLHFLFDWTGGAVAAALFSAVNESIWEHMKLLFYPMLLFAVIQWRVWGREAQGFWRVKLAGITVGLALIPVLYYTYTGALGVEADWFNIAIFFLTAGAVFWAETKFLLRGRVRPLHLGIAAGLLCLMVLTFTVLTFLPPKLPLFQDPVTGTYGYQAMMNKPTRAAAQAAAFL